LPKTVSVLQSEIAKRLTAICTQIMPLLAPEVSKNFIAVIMTILFDLLRVRLLMLRETFFLLHTVSKQFVLRANFPPLMVKA